MEGIEEARRRVRYCLETGEKGLNLEYLDIRDLNLIPELKECKHLIKLRLDRNQIIDLSPLSGLISLTELWLTNNQIVDLSPLSGLSSLTELWLTNNQIVDLSPLSGLSSLKGLILDFNNIVNLSPLSGLNSLKGLTLDDNQIVDLSPLSGLISLTELWFTNNQIVDLSPLYGLSSLTYLLLGNNQIVDLSPLSGLISLTKLWLSNNQIVDLNPLSGLNSLTWLILDGNLIVDLSPLSGLSSLKELIISKNQIVNFDPLLELKPYINGSAAIVVNGNPNETLNNIVLNGYEGLKAYYDEQDREGTISTDRLKVIVVGNSTAGKTSLVKYWGNKTFDERQVTTHGIYTPMDIPLGDEEHVRVNVWDFGGQDYYHATHRLFITRDSTFILVCARELENKPEEELTKEYVLENGEVTEKEVRVQHYPYNYWLQTLNQLTGADKNQHKMPLFLVENKCGLYTDNARMHLTQDDRKKTPFEIIGDDFFHLDIKRAWEMEEIRRKYPAISLSWQETDYEKFEKSLLDVLQKQIKENRHEIISYFPEVRDTLEKLAELKQNEQVPHALNELLAENKINTIESYTKLPVWISYTEYQDIVYRARKNKEGEPPWEALHIYLQNICGRIFHFKDIPALEDIVFIDPNWLHQTIYKVLSPKVREKEGRFSLEEADEAIDGDILDAARFMDVMKAFELVFEIPNQKHRTFVASQYLPPDSKLSSDELNTLIDLYHEKSLTLRFSDYLPPSLIARLISLKGHLIINLKDPLWRNGIIYSEDRISTCVLCKPKEKKIEIYLGRGISVSEKQHALRKFMEFMEEYFSDDMHEMLVSLPDSTSKVKWKHLYASKKSGRYGAKDYSSPNENTMTDTVPFAFLVQDFERKPIHVFICYSHQDKEAMKIFTAELNEQLESFSKQHGIKISSFSDLQLGAGDEWDTVLQENISKTDVLICLLSSGFFKSKYVQDKEYGKVFNELREGHRNTLIVPVYFKSCYIAAINEIRSLQFYKPSVAEYFLPENEELSFINLVERNRSQVPNYVAGLIRELAPHLRRIWEVR